MADEHEEGNKANAFEPREVLHLKRSVPLFRRYVTPCRAVIFSILFGNSFLHAQALFNNTLVPQPTHVQQTDRPAMAVDASFCLSLPAEVNVRLQRASLRTTQRIAFLTGLSLSGECRSSTSPALSVQVDSQDTPPLSTSTDESYMIDSDSRPIVLHAATIYGAMRGFETILQLIRPQGSSFVLPAVRIQDSPRFHWRGLMLDAGRHFLPTSVIYRTLDGMAAVKLNVLHWHLTEDQGFRMESHRFPRFQEFASDGQFYTQQQVRDIVSYAADRGIRVVPEFDIPGHATSWVAAYPELASAPGPYRVERTFGIHDAALDPSRESTYRFLDTFFGEMTALFPDAYVHIGGDESNGKEWLANAHIRAFMQRHSLKTTVALQAYFNRRVQKILAAHGKRMIGWDEVISPDLPRQVAIQDWHKAERLIAAVKQGHASVFSQPSFFYLDHIHTADVIYSADPLPESSGLTAAEEPLVLGGEACMWSEHIDGHTIDSRLWPMAAVVAERLWSPRTTRDEDDMYRRLRVMSLRLEADGLTHLSGPEAGLRDLAGANDDSALRTLASVVQPVSFTDRARQQHTDALTPLNHFVDYTVPDPPLRHYLQVLVVAYLRDRKSDPTQAGKEASELNAIFQHWSSVSPALEQTVRQSPLLAEVQPRVTQLSLLAILGSEALARLREGNSSSDEWRHNASDLLKQSADHTGLVDFVVIDPLRSLVAATAAP